MPVAVWCRDLINSSFLDWRQSRIVLDRSPGNLVGAPAPPGDRTPMRGDAQNLAPGFQQKQNPVAAAVHLTSKSLQNFGRLFITRPHRQRGANPMASASSWADVLA